MHKLKYVVNADHLQLENYCLGTCRVCRCVTRRELSGRTVAAIVEGLEDTDGAPCTVVSDETDSLRARALAGPPADPSLRKLHSPLSDRCAVTVRVNGSIASRVRGDGGHMRTVSRYSFRFHLPSWCRRLRFRTPGCTSVNGGAYCVAIEAVEKELEWDFSEEIEPREVDGVSSDGVPRPVGEDRTSGETIRREDRGTMAGVALDRDSLLGRGRALMFGTSTGKFAGKVGRSAFFRMLRVRTGMVNAPMRMKTRGIFVSFIAIARLQIRFTSLTSLTLFMPLSWSPERSLCRQID
ncbi:hypothetical protein C8R45DRAFT_988560 [Mycena sanguinolenta]|nr:hypothetical protein C8R45DRAFT_988560 [Mycena sanguinolenta]